ncbi:DMT family transporter [Biostraticola tofi]|uniref:EamA domain-containing membrane protein RarD n=1 Tax=Biostraticola tofi TaxID=466109 RepID=A0A4R3YQA4_9GAMM|nr:DMT family transporter [Biostraticola tofi]TCV95085.1 EamA domain-containing membrane protein RarD [Biostraticola tofi]
MNKRIAIIGLNISALFFGISGILGKVINLTPAAIVFGRALFAVGVLALLMICVRSFRWEWISGKSLRVVILGALFLAGHWLTFFIAVKTAGVAIATLGFASFPAFTTLGESVAFRERIHLPEWTLIGLICLGLVLVCPSFDFSSGGTRGFLWGILSGGLLALLIICNRLTALQVRPVQAALCQNLVIMLLLLPAAWGALLQASAVDWLGLLALGALCTGVAHSLLVTSLRFVKARAAAVFFALEPVYAILFAWILFAEQPSLMMFAGAALIILSVVGYALYKAD